MTIDQEAAIMREAKVRAAAAFARKFGADRVVVVFTNPSGQYGYASYGVDVDRCVQAQALGDRLFEEIRRWAAAGGGSATTDEHR